MFCKACEYVSENTTEKGFCHLFHSPLTIQNQVEGSPGKEAHTQTYQGKPSRSADVPSETWSKLLGSLEQKHSLLKERLD